jgi:hypothetical protein
VKSLRFFHKCLLAAIIGTYFFAPSFAEGDAPHYLLIKIDSTAQTAEEILGDSWSSIEPLPVFRSTHREDGTSLFRLGTFENDVQRILSHMKSRPGVLYAEMDQKVYAYFTPNDPQFATQWHLSKIQAEAAWDYDTTEPLYGGDSSVVIAVLDTGIAYENYVDQSTSYQKAPDFSLTTFVSGYDFLNSDTHANDDNGHGTHVAATIAESTNNGLNGAGLAFSSSIMPVKVLDRNGVGNMSDIATAIDYAVANQADIINLSLGYTSPSQTLKEAVDRALAAGVVVVAAAGNDSRGSLSYPALYPGVIAVGALGRDDILSSFSNYGDGISLTAPGGDDSEYIWQESFSNLDANGLPLDYSTFNLVGYQGTSQAAPQVSAAAALLIARGVSGMNVKTLLENAATDLGVTGYDTTYGYGRLDIARAFSLYLNDATAPISTSTIIPSAPDGSVGYYVTQPTVTLTATDESGGSGVSRIQYRWDGGLAVLYSSPLLPPQGSHTLSFAAIDGAGNQEIEKTQVILVDSIGPVITINSPNLDVNNPTVTISGTVTDASSGVRTITLDGTQIDTDASGNFSFTKRFPIGVNTLTFSSFDHAGKETILIRNVTVTYKERIVIGAGPGGGPQVVVASNRGEKIFSLFALQKSFRGGINVAVCDVNGDGTGEVITAPRSQGQPVIKIFSNQATFLKSFYAYQKKFLNGIRVACNDFDGDGKEEIVTSPNQGEKPVIKIFRSNGTLVRKFTAYTSSFRGGVNVALGDVNGDGKKEIITAPDGDFQPQIKIFSEKGKKLRSFSAYPKSFTGGVRVAVGDIDQNGREEIITGPGSGGGPQIRIFSQKGNLLKQFFVFEKSYRGGIEIAAGDVNGDGDNEIVVGTGKERVAEVRIYSIKGKRLYSFYPYSKKFTGGVTVSTGITD